jgi:hypothetical protein
VRGLEFLGQLALQRVQKSGWALGRAHQALTPVASEMPCTEPYAVCRTSVSDAPCEDAVDVDGVLLALAVDEEAVPLDDNCAIPRDAEVSKKNSIILIREMQGMVQQRAMSVGDGMELSARAVLAQESRQRCCWRR